MIKRYERRWGIETSNREHNAFLAKTTLKDYAISLLYYAAALCIYNARCVFNPQRQDNGGVIALELKIRLLMFLVSSFSLRNNLMPNEDYG